jgi:hypothetical protein
MSRLTALHIPFVSGHNDAVDPRVMPDGVFTDIRNGRLRKSGSLTVRGGWRPVDMTDMATANDFVVHDLYSFRGSLVALGTLGASAAQYLGTKVDSSSTRPWRVYTDATIRPATQVRYVGNLADMSQDAWSVSCALTSDGVYGCAIYQYSVGGLSETVTRVFKTANDETVAQFNDAEGYAKVFSLGSTFGRVRLETTNLRYATLNPTDTSPTFATVATLEAGITAGSPFDVAVARETTPTHLHTVVTMGGAVTYRRYDVSTGVQSGADKTVAAANVTSFPSIACNDVSARVLTKSDVGDVLSLLTFASTGVYTTTSGPTALFSSEAIDSSRFCVGLDNSLTYVAAQRDSNPDVYTAVYDSSHTLLDTATYRSCWVTSGWVFSNPYAGIGLAREADHDRGSLATFCYTDATGPWLWTQPGTASSGISNELTGTPGRVAAPGQNLLGDVLSSGYGFVSTWTTFSTIFFRLNVTERRPAAAFADTLYLSGGVLTQWSGNDTVENGMAAPVIRSLVQGTTGSLTVLGTYSYRAVLTWFDEIRGVHRSVVSLAENVTLTGANDSVEVSVDVPKTLRRNSNVGSNPTLTIFRTESGPGELFYQIYFDVVSPTEDTFTFTDTLADASILTAARIYTEGEFGAVSGVLDIAPPRPSAHIATMRDRIVLGSAGSSYQVSQTLLPEEPIAFAEPGVSGPAALSYFDSVEGRLTTVTTLDDTIVLGTRDGIFLAGGEGPNLAGIGSFQSPARLPSDVGIYSEVSVIETSEGLWFLGSEGKLYLLPRGGGVPTFAGEAVQDRFVGNVVGAARETVDAIVAWAVDDGTLIVHDIDHGYWMGDDLPFTPVALITHEGRMFAAADDGVVWEYSGATYGDGTGGSDDVVLQATTGQIQVFGMTGQGRIASIEVLGEIIGSGSILSLEISYDDAVSWTSLGSYSLLGTEGDTFQRQFYPANQRGGRFRLRLTAEPAASSVESCRLTGFTVYYRTASGPSRLPSASRN